MAWTSLKNALSLHPAPSERATVGEAEPMRFERGRRPESRPLSLDAIGQRDEVVRQRITAMIDRLDDLRTLQEDFSSILEPLTHISNELPRASMRIAELESSLSAERQSASTSRQEAAELTRRLALLGNELSDANDRANRALGDLKEREAAVEEQRVSLRDRTLSAENLERQLFAETEQNKALIGENKALRIEAQAADSALSRSEHELLAARERIGILDQDNLRLQQMSETQGVRLAELGARCAELDNASDTDRQRLHVLESQLTALTAERERTDAQHEVEISATRSERAGLTIKLEAATNRLASTEQLLVQARNQLREKDEAFRFTDRNLKEANIARATAERRLDSLQADIGRQTERLLDLQRGRSELEARCEMLNKALAAKDAAHEQANGRVASLAERLDQLTFKHESTRSELETINRRLAEDLENERSERALLQGALDIARESRSTLQKQHDALKRSGRGWRDAVRADDEPGGHQRTAESNVRPFAAPTRDD